MRADLRFSLSFLALCSVLYLVLHGLPEAFFAPINDGYASAMGTILAGAGLDPTVDGSLVTLQGFTVQVIGECSALFILPLLISFILAYPSTIRHRVIGLALGIPALAAANAIRLCVLILVGVHARNLFSFVHVYLGQVMMVFVLVSICLVWVFSLRRGDGRSAASFGLIFVVVSGLSFLIWTQVSQPYVLVNFKAVSWVVSWFGPEVELPAQLSLYPHTFFTLNLVLYTGLILASRGLSRLRSLSIGWALLLVMNLVFILCQALFFQLEVRALFQPINVLLVLNQWLLPVFLWLAFARKGLFLRTG